MNTRLPPPSVSTRFADTRPTTYDAATHTVTATLSTGSPVVRPYGTEVLAISPRAVDLGRVRGAGIPVLDSHDQGSVDNVLGRIERAWFEGDALVGEIKFSATDRGKAAEAMVARGELTSVSIGYRVITWQIADSDGKIVDPDRVRFTDDDYIFTATKWELLESSFVSVPADARANVRSLAPLRRSGRKLVLAARMRMRLRMVLSAVSFR